MKLVFIHGSAGSKNNFKYLIQELQEFDCLAFDLIGFGKEKKPKIKYDVKTFFEFIEKKVNVKEKMVVVGHSLGAILAKELALQYPKSVEKVFLINYPMNKEAVKKHWLSGMFLRENVISKILCHTKIIWKYFLYPFYFIFNHKYFESFKDYFRHTNHSETSSTQHVFLQDNTNSFEKRKNKIVFISGSKDPFVIRKITKKYKEYIILGMKHVFFNYEKEIAQIIKKELS